MSPMPRKLCSATAVGKDNIFIVLGEKVLQTLWMLTIDVYKEGLWINTIHMYEAGCHLSDMQFIIHEAHLFKFSVTNSSCNLYSSAISNFTESGEITWEDNNIGVPRNVLEELYEPNSKMKFWCMSNPIFFCNSLIVLIIGRDRQTLAFYVHHHGKWRKDILTQYN